MSSSRRLAIAAILVLAVGAAPPRWLGWTADLAALVWIPLAPLAHAATAAREWVRPLEDPAGERRTAAELRRERDEYRGLAARLRIENERLESRLGVLEGVGSARAGASFEVLSAIVLSTPRHGEALRIGRGSRHGVVAGAVVMLPGDRLVGRVAAPVGRHGADVLLAAGERSGSIRARVEEADGGLGRLLLLEPDGRGGWRSERETSGDLVGRRVRLDDPTWPAAAQGLLLGEIRRERPLAARPLRSELEVAPVWEPGDLAVVAVRIPRDDPTVEPPP
jgi:hypothetical protein